MRRFSILLMILLAIAVFSADRVADIGEQIFVGPIVANNSAGLSSNLVIVATHGVTYTGEETSTGKVYAYDPEGNKKWGPYDLGSSHVYSTGAHVYWKTANKNFLVISPLSGNNAKIYEFDSSMATSLDIGSIMGWSNMYGSIAAFAASETNLYFYPVVIGVDEMGQLKAGIFQIDTTPSIVDSGVASKDLGANTYSSLAVAGYTGESNEETVTIFVGTDEAFYVFKLYWNASVPSVTLTEVASALVDIGEKIQSGIAAYTENKAYFLTSSITGSKFYVADVTPDGTLTLTSFPIPGYPQITNSPVIDNSGNVYFVADKSVYWYNGSTVEPYAHVGEDIYAAPVLADDGNIYVVSALGNVYKISYGAAELVSTTCYRSVNYVYSPPVIRGGKMFFGDYAGRLCMIDLSDYRVDGMSGKWPAFGKSDGRTSVNDYNPPYSVSLRLEALLMDNVSLDGYGIPATYAYQTDTGETTGTDSFDFTLLVPDNQMATVCALDHGLDTFDFNSIISGVETVSTDTSYTFNKWDFPFTSNRCATDLVTTAETWKVKYKKYYKVIKALVNTVDNTLVTSTATWVEEGTTYTLTTFSGNWDFGKWEVYKSSNTPQVYTSESISLTVDAPILAIEYATKVYGTVEWEFPEKVQLLWGASTGTFISTLTITDVLTDTASAKVFYVKLDLPEGYTLKNSSRIVSLVYPINVSATTAANIDYTVPGASGIEYYLSLSTPVQQATDIVQLILEIEYTQDATLSDVFTKDNIFARIEDEVGNRGLMRVVTTPTTPTLPEYPLGDFNLDKKVNEVDLAMLADHYGLTENDTGWDEKFDIGPRVGFVPPTDYKGGPYTPGYLIIESPRKIDYEDMFIFAHMYGYTAP